MKKNILAGVAILLFLTAVAFSVVSVAVYSDSLKIERGKDELASTYFGVRGDYIGGVAGTALSFSTVLLVIVGLIVQQLQLDFEKKERKDEWDLRMLEKLALERAKQEDEKRRQLERFERTFFEMLSLHHRIIETGRIWTQQGNLEGRSALLRVASALVAQLQASRSIQRSYLDVFEEYDYIMDHFLKHLGEMAKFIEVSPVEDKKKYGDILWAQLSVAEMTCLYFYGLSLHGMRYKLLIEKFGLLRGYQVPEHPSEGNAEYQPTAYGTENVVVI